MATRKRKHPRQYAVIGLGRFGTSVAQTLYEMGCEVLAIDSDEEKVQMVANTVTHAVQADATDEGAMRALGLRNFDVAIVSIGDVQASILTTLVLKEMGIKWLIAKALSELHGRVLEKIGADKVIYPERDMGMRVAHNLISGSIVDYVELAPGYSIIEVVAQGKYSGRTLKELDLRARYGVSIMAIKRGAEVIVAPGANDYIQTGDQLIAIGKDEMLERFEQAETTA
ncbi:MAG: TrkA family potassium uptake protein [Firmicutes bacterium]|nr:TrkA family potassium uptake protein [Bacillota bacterium]